MTKQEHISYYGASCLRHAGLWQSWAARKYGTGKKFLATATWPEAVLAGALETNPLEAKDFWLRDIQQVRQSNVLICYAEEGDVLRGAICEVGAALGLSKPVVLVAPKDLYSLSTWQYHPLVHHKKSLSEAFDWLWDSHKGFGWFVD